MLWKTSDEADCGLVFLIEFFSHSCRDLQVCELGELDRASSVGRLDEHPDNSFKTALSRPLPIMSLGRRCSQLLHGFVGD